MPRTYNAKATCFGCGKVFRYVYRQWTVNGKTYIHAGSLMEHLGNSPNCREAARYDTYDED